MKGIVGRKSFVNTSARLGALLLFFLFGANAILWPVAAVNWDGPEQHVQAQKSQQQAQAQGQNQLNESKDTPKASDKARLTAIRFLSSNSYTRVMMDLSQGARFEAHRLPANLSGGLPPRIYVDILNTVLALPSNEPVQVRDGLLRQIRVGQFSPDVVRVVLDMESLRSHNIFLLPDPFRLVIDIQGQQPDRSSAASEKNGLITLPGKNGKSTPAGIKKIVLDPGHGGKDPGAIGVGGIAEKDIVLAVAKKLARKLKRDMDIDVVLTRNTDTFVPLEDRTAVANKEDADLFVSLHMNASPKGDARGIETYYLDNTTDEASMRLAARENGASGKPVSDLQFILSDMIQNMKLEDSISLAHRLHGSMITNMSKKMSDVRDLGVKKALFYVLVGARMPSVLVEMFFITNRYESRIMKQEGYQNAIVDALYDGIREYDKTILAAKTL